MQCTVNSEDSRAFAPTNPVFGSFFGLVVAALLTLGLSAYMGTSQADDITDRVKVDLDKVKGEWKKKAYNGTVVVTNTSPADILAPLQLIITEFKNQRHLLKNAVGVTDEGYSYIEIDLPNGVLGVGESTTAQPIVFKKMSGKAWKKWKKANKTQLAAKVDDDQPPGWSEHDFPIKFNFLVTGNSPDVPPVTLMVSQPDAVPGALQINNGDVDVRVTVSVLTNMDTPVGSVLLRSRPQNNDCDPDDPYCCYYQDCSEIPLNDDGINGDLEANDGIFSTIDTIDTDELESGECRSYIGVAFGELTGEVRSDEYLLCATHLPTELVESNNSEQNQVPFGDAKVLGDEFLVRFEPGASTEEFQKLLGAIRGRIVGTMLEDGLHQIRFDGILSEDRLRELIDLFSQQEGVVSVVPNYVGLFTSIPSDPEFPNQHGLQLVSAEPSDSVDRPFVWDAGATGAGVQVVVLDSGVEPEHRDDLNPKGEFGKDTNDLLGHGTEMAGIIAVATDNETGIAAIARDAEIRSVRISKTNNISLSDMLDGFKRAKGYAGRNKVISASFSIKNMLSDGGVCRKINQIINRGAIVVVSAGNDNDDSTTGIVPGNCNSPDFDIFTSPGPVNAANKASLIVVGASSCSVGACEEDSRWTESGSVGSNFGNDWVDISAPGVDIMTTTLGDNYVAITGTSASTALVAGAAAILRSCDVGGSLASTDGNSSTLGLNLADVFNVMNLGAITPVDELPNRLNVYYALESVNTVPGGIVLSNDQVNDGTDTTGGFEVAEIGFSDDTVCDSHTIEITGGADAASFSIGGDLDDRLIIDDGTLFGDRKSSYEVEITVNDFYGASATQLFTIGVN